MNKRSFKSERPPAFLYQESALMALADETADFLKARTILGLNPDWNSSSGES